MDLRARCLYLRQRACRQTLVLQTDTQTHLNRCLSTLQMTAIGIGSTIGVGIYVLLGVAIREMAGPGVLLSFLMAGLVVLTNAVIYAEFGSYIPHTGAAYTYIYRVLGELAAFLTGWMGTLSLLCSAATGARAWSGFVDSLFNHSIQQFWDEKIGQMHIGPPFSQSLDLVACIFFLLVTLVVSFNVHCSSLINTVLAVLTTGVLVFVAIAGPIYGDVKRVANLDGGGFLPFGLGGVIAGASAAFFAFNGFDSICISAEEARDPVKSVPRAILIELIIVTLTYCGAAIGTLSLIPYSAIDLRAPIPSAFDYQGVTWAKLLATIGPVIAITNMSILSLYAQSRISYRMAKDGLLFSRFAYINPKTQVPLLGVVVFGILVSIISLLLELKDLVQFAVLCMLFQYIILAPSLISLRCADKGKVSVAHNNNAHNDDNHVLGCIEVPDPSHKFKNGKKNGRSKRTAQHPRDPLTAYSYASEGDLGSGSDSAGRNSQVDFVSGDVVVGDGEGVERDVESLLVNFDGDDTAEHEIRSMGAAVSTMKTERTLNSDRILKIERNKSNNADRNGDRRAPGMGDNTDVFETLTERTRPALPAFLDDEDSSDSDLPQALRDALSSQRPRGDAEDLKLWGHGEMASDCVAKQYGWFGRTVHLFFRDFLTTRLCLVLLMVVLAGLSLQLGLGWEDLKALNPWALFFSAALLALSIFLCEVLRARCGPGNHQGFKVPCVPYLPALSAFLNMLLLVSASDFMGIMEFIVLVGLGLVIYIIMVMSEWKKSLNDVTRVLFNQSQENVSLLNDGSDADSEGSF